MRFPAPTLPTLPMPVEAPAPPAAEVTERALLPDDARVSARNARLGRDAVLAVGPVPERAVSWELLRSLLARGEVPVLDLTGIDLLRARVEPTARGGAPALDGPLLAAVWAAQLGSATHLLVTEALAVSTEAVRVERRAAPSGESAGRYQGDLAQAAARCRALAERIDRDLASAEGAWREAERRYRDAQNVFTTPDPAGEAGARAAYDAAVSTLHARREACQALAARTAAPPESVRVAEAAMPVARGSFRIVAVPGGALVWSASLVRAAPTREGAVTALLGALLDALPGFARTADAPAAAEGRHRGGRRRRHHGDR